MKLCFKDVEIKAQRITYGKGILKVFRCYHSFVIRLHCNIIVQATWLRCLIIVLYPWGLVWVEKSIGALPKKRQVNFEVQITIVYNIFSKIPICYLQLFTKMKLMLVWNNFSFSNIQHTEFCRRLCEEKHEEKMSPVQGLTRGVRGLGLKLPPWAWNFTKTLLPAQRRLIVFTYRLLCHWTKPLHENFLRTPLLQSRNILARYVVHDPTPEKRNSVTAQRMLV